MSVQETRQRFLKHSCPIWGWQTTPITPPWNALVATNCSGDWQKQSILDPPTSQQTDIPQMNPWNGANRSSLPGSGEAMGVQPRFPAASALYDLPNDV